MDAELTQELLTRGGFTRLDTDISGVSQPAEEIGGGYEQGGIGNSEPAPSANSSNSGATHPAADERSYLITMLIEELTQLACLSPLSTGVKSVRDANEKARRTAEENMINICSQLRRDNLSWDQIILMTCYGEQEATFKAYLEIAMYDVDRQNIASAAANTLLTHTPPHPPPMPQSASPTAGNIPVTPRTAASKLCKFLNRGGRCHHGCTPTKTYCHKYHRGQCHRGLDCRYAHS